MGKKRTKAFASVTLISLVVTAALSTISVKAEAGQVTRIGEIDRYETAATVATTNWTSSKNVVLVCGEGYADAVSAAVLAKQLNAPILLTTADSLSGDAEVALRTLEAQNIYVIGGPASISQSIRDSLKEYGYNLKELGGKTRYETNVAVAKQLIKLGVKVDKVMLVGGEGFSDALSVAPIAATKGQILLLGSNDEASMKPILDFVKTNSSKITVVGTSNVISDSMYNALGAVERVKGGDDRFETNLNVLNKFAADLKLDKLYVANATEDDGYADALVASALAGNTASPLVLVDTESSVATNNAVSYIKTKATESTDLNVIGGTGVVTDNTVTDINNAVIGNSDTNDDGNSKTTTSGAVAVSSISTNGLNQIKVAFNKQVDKDRAELTSNYQIDGADLTDDQATADLQDDKSTVLITLADPYSQYQDVIVTVKNGVLDKDSNNIITQYDKKVTFSDTTIPVLKSVEVSGSNKLTVQFSVPINMTLSDLSSMKINGQSLLNFGLNNELTVFKEQSGSYADKVKLYFDTPIPIGSNTFEIPDGTVNEKFSSAAGFTIKDTKMDFTVNEETGKPQVTKVTGDTTGTIYITFNRAMDTKTALAADSYQINSAAVDVPEENITFDDGSDDTIVKIKGLSSLINKGENVLHVSNKVKDAYGNKVDDNTNVGFDVADDSTKPQVTSVNMINSQTMRIEFSKDVANVYATNKTNFKLIDSEGIDITRTIDSINPTSGLDEHNTDTYDIKFAKANALTDSKYTLTIKNIIDTNEIPNAMDDYTTTIKGISDIAPTVTAIVKKADDAQKVVIFFSKAMDKDSITNASNYYFMNGKEDNKQLPVSMEITSAGDDKSVTIQFPTNYILGAGTDENCVVKIGIANVKDQAGNGLSGVAYADTISANYTDGPSLVTNTTKLSYDGDDVKAQIHLSSALESLNLADFAVAGQVPDSGIVSGENVILTFKDGVQDNTKINAIKAAEINAQLTIANPGSTDAAGRKLQAGTDKVYYMLLAPRTKSSAWTASSDAVTLAFDENIDNRIEGSYDNDFIFTNARTGQKLNVTAVTTDGMNVIYQFDDDSIDVGDKINIRATGISADITIRGQKDADGNYPVYAPSSDDLKIRTIIAE